ncbi:GlcG/HbpS family heme-binding protein [Elongatibacter sediminis]|uniref:Heme-binding protein n=1 Tax=Elongatibacter sediminis TaxID=3119006 RepID=A0AAW9RLE4_9GAMM
MIRNIRIPLAIAACAAAALIAGSACAQSSSKPATLADIVVTGEAAEKSFEKHLLRLDIAEQVAHACFDHARENGFTVALHIVDQFGYTLYAGRMDGAQADAVESSALKARTALYFREPTRVWMGRSIQTPLMGQLVGQLNQFPVTGGLPIIVENQLVGAIGAGGASSDQDEECARTGLISVLGEQPSLASPE